MSTTTIDRQFDDLMKTALGDDETWTELVSDPGGLGEAERWLKSTTIQIDQQISQRQVDLEQWRLTPEDPESAESIREVQAWRRKALFMKGLCAKRLVDLKVARRERADRSDQLRRSLLALGEVVRRHERGELSDDALHRQLDEVVMPTQQAGETLSLRQVLAARSS